MQIFFNFIIKVCFITSMMILSGFLSNRIKDKTFNSIIQGILFSIIVYIDMTNPFITSNNSNYDAREVLLNISGIYYGPISCFITGFFTMVLRFYRGTQGTFPAIISIVLIVLTTFIFYLKTAPKGKNTEIRTIFLLSFITNAISFFSIILVPENIKNIQSTLIALLVLVIYPTATIASAMIINYINMKIFLTNELEKKEDLLTSIFLNSQHAALILKDNTIMQANKRTLNLFGYDDFKEMSGKSFLNFFQVTGKECGDFLNGIISGKIDCNDRKNCELAILNKFKEKIPVEMEFFNIHSHDKKYTYVSMLALR